MRIEDYIIPENVIPIIRNKQVLEDLPKDNIFISKEDLVILFRIEIPMQIETGVGLIQVTDKIIDLWGMNTQEVYEKALKNMQERDIVKIYTMDSVLNHMLSGTQEEEVMDLKVFLLKKFWNKWKARCWSLRMRNIRMVRWEF